MKLIGNLKKQVDKEKGMSEKKKLIEEAGMELTDAELEQVTGGGDGTPTPPRNINKITN